MKILVSDLIRMEELIPVLLDNDFGIEITNFTMSSSLDDWENHSELMRGKLSASGVNKIYLHGPFIDMVPASMDTEIRNTTFDRFNTAYDIAKIIKAEKIIFHTGYIAKMHYPEIWYKNSVDFWREFLKDKKEGIKILIENVLEDDYILLSKLVEEISNPDFSVCLDIGHLNVSSSKSMENWIKGLNSKIGHVHLHNNNGMEDNHYGLDNGNIEIIKVFEFMEKYSPNASFTLELFSLNDLEKSVALLKKLNLIQ